MYKPIEISNEEYHAREEISSSNIRDILKNPKKFLYKYKGEEKNEPTKAMEEGTAVHSFFLENNNFHKEYIFKPKGLKGTTKEGKEWIKDNCNKKILSYEWQENLEQMKKSVLDSAGKLIYDNDNYSELSYFWLDLHGIKGKCRPDCISYEKRYVIDLKTTQDASHKGFQNSILKFGYHIQVGWYLRGLKKLNIEIDKFIFVVIEKTAPFCVGVYELDKDFILEGNKQIEKAIQILDLCREQKTYPDYTSHIETISLPPWMANKKVTPKNYQEIELY